MLPTIGLMVGATGVMVSFYIFVRMCQVFDDDENPTIIQVFAVLGIVGSILGILVLGGLSVDLVTAATSVSSGLGQFQ